MNEHSFGDDPSRLMSLASKGDADAFGRVYELYFTPVYRYIYFRVRSQHEAEDLTQAVFLKSFQSISKFKSQSVAPLAYFFTIARNTIIDHWRKKKEIPMGDREDVVKNSAVHEEENPSDILFKRETREKVHEAIKYLTPEQQEIILLKFISDLSNKEISALLGKTEVAIRQLQCRALRALKNYLTEHET